jgi:hypothetical protein
LVQRQVQHKHLKAQALYLTQSQQLVVVLVVTTTHQQEMVAQAVLAVVAQGQVLVMVVVALVELTHQVKASMVAVALLDKLAAAAVAHLK